MSNSSNLALDKAVATRKRERGPVVFNGLGLSNHTTVGTDNYFDTEPHAAITGAFVDLENLILDLVVQDLPLKYVAGAITSGIRSVEQGVKTNKQRLADAAKGIAGNEPIKTTYKIGDQLGSVTLSSDVVAPNVRDLLKFGDHVQRLFPDSIVCVPSEREMAIGAMARDPDLNRFMTYNEEEFMAVWFNLQFYKSDGTLSYPTQASTRNTVYELQAAILRMAGLVPDNTKPMLPFDKDGKPVNVITITRWMADGLAYHLGHGFEARELATALAQIFTIDEWVRAGEVPDWLKPKLPADWISRVDPALRGRSAEELAAMDKLRERIKPILLNYCAAYLRLDGLPQEYQDAFAACGGEPQPIPSDVQAEFTRYANWISANQDALLSINISDETKDRLNGVPQPAPYQRYDSSAPHPFADDWRAYIFEDNFYTQIGFENDKKNNNKQVLVWEGVALRFAIGATEIARFPLNNPMATYISADMKRGPHGAAAAEEECVDDIEELLGVLGRDSDQVVQANLADAERIKAEQKKAHPARVIMNTPAILRICDAIEKNRMVYDGQEGRPRFIAAHGSSKTSPKMRLALELKFIDRKVDRFASQAAWWKSPSEVQKRLRCRLIQAGMAPRPAGDQAGMRVYTQPNLRREENLIDDIKQLTNEVERCVDTGVRAPEQALALLRTITLYKMIISPKLAQGIIPDTFNGILLEGNQEAVKPYLAKAENLLLNHAMRWVPRERLEATAKPTDNKRRQESVRVQNVLMQPYLVAQKGLLAEQDEKKVQNPRSSVHQDYKGPQM